MPSTVRRLVIASLTATCAVSLAAATACTHNPKPDPNAVPAEPESATTVRVQNQAFLDYTIYVYRGGARARLGTVSGNSTVVLTIPRSFVGPAVQLRFIANPIGGRRQPVSEEVTVSPGDEMILVIPPGTS